MEANQLPTKPGPYYWRESDGDKWKLGNVFEHYDKRFYFETFNIGGKHVVDLQGQWLPIPTAEELVELQAAKKMVDKGDEIVSCNNKPPMTVWLTGKQTPCGATNEQHDVFSPYGPYVHLEQFMQKYYGH